MPRTRRNDDTTDRAVAARAYASVLADLFHESITPRQLCNWLAKVMGVKTRLKRIECALAKLDRSLCSRLSRKERDFRLAARSHMEKMGHEITQGIARTAHGHLSDGGFTAFGQRLPLGPNAEYEALPADDWHGLQLDIHGERATGNGITYVSVRIARLGLVLPHEERELPFLIMEPARRGHVTLRIATEEERKLIEQEDATDQDWRSGPMWRVPENTTTAENGSGASERTEEASKQPELSSEATAQAEETTGVIPKRKRGPRTGFDRMIQEAFEELRQTNRLPASRNRTETARLIHTLLKLKHPDMTTRIRGLPAFTTIRKAMPKCY